MPDQPTPEKKRPGQLRPWNKATIAQAAKNRPNDAKRARSRVRPAVRELLDAKQEDEGGQT